MRTFLFCTVVLGMMIGCRPKANGNTDSNYKARRQSMVTHQLIRRGIADKRLLAVMRTVRRHLFVPRAWRDRAYGDHPLPIGLGQTISQPYIVAYMTEKLKLKGTEKVLEIGTGSGYQAAVLGRLAKTVFSIEIVRDLGLAAKARLKKLGYNNVSVRVGDGYKGWPKVAPFDRIIVTAAPPKVPQALLDQLKVGGILILPLGPRQHQVIVTITRTATGYVRKNLIGVRFVPMVHKPKK